MGNNNRQVTYGVDAKKHENANIALTFYLIKLRASIYYQNAYLVLLYH
jgi:hypothetical protein